MKTLVKSIIASLVFTLFVTQMALAKDGDIKICGVIESVDVSQVTLDGVSYPLESDTEYEDENGNNISLSDFAIGELIELRIRDGEVDQLEKEDEPNCGGGDDDDDDNSSSGGDDDDDDDDSSSGGDDDDDDDSSSGGEDDDDDDNGNSGNSNGNKDREKVCGQIAALTATTITVGTREFTVTADTEFESNSGEPLTFSAFSIGDYVKVDIRNGSLHEVEFETSASCRSKKAESKNQDKKTDKSTTRRTRLRTKLFASSGVETSARGAARYESRAKKGKARDRFRINVKVPVPSTTPAAASAQEASTLQLSAFIQRGTDTLAICQLQFDRVRNGIAQYKVDLRERDGAFRSKKGSCDIDLAQADTQNGIPSFNKGDDITILQSDLSSLLEGQL